VVFWFQTWKFQKPSQDRASFWSDYEGYMLNFHIHVLNLFKSWSNLGFDQDSNGHNLKKCKIKAHSLLMSYSKHSIKLINKV
jgi:hypothetical protein